MALKRKKTYQSLVDKIDDTKLALESQLAAIENANINLETFQAMSDATTAMKNIHKGINVDKVTTSLFEFFYHSKCVY